MGPAPKGLFTKFAWRGGASPHHIGENVPHESIDVPMISPHVCRHLLKSRGPKSTKYAPLGKKVAKRTISNQWFKVSSIIVVQQPSPEGMKLFRRCLGWIEVGTCKRGDVMSEVLPANEMFATMSAGWSAINRVSTNIQWRTVDVKNPMRKCFMSFERVVVSKHKPTGVTFQSCLCERKRVARF